MLVYCTRCVLPDSKPDLTFDAEGVCNACRNFELRETLDWDARAKELEAILAKYRSETSWDCVVPVSGGKDSTYQVLKMIEMGMRPLAVTSTTCDLSDIGRRNIRALQRIGVDHVEVSPNPIVRSKLNRVGLERVGDISWPEHVGIFTIPVRAAVMFEVPLIVWGENSQNEYGGPASAVESQILNRRWLEEFGGLLGLRVSDLEHEGIDARDLKIYEYPNDDELLRVGVTGVFLGYFIPWDGLSNYLLSQTYGFSGVQGLVEGSMVNYENVDNHQTGIHDYFKYLKFGFGRTSDIASLHVRRGRISREDAVGAVRRLEGGFPWTYLGKPLAEILQPLGLTIEQFCNICDRFTNRHLFEFESQGVPARDKRGNLVPKFVCA